MRAVPVGKFTDGRQYMKDYYKILGVDRQAQPEEIKKHTVSWQSSIIPMW